MRKRELWENNKNALQRFKVNFSLWFMRYQRQTHGIGLMILMLIGIIIVFMLYNTITSMLEADIINKQADCLVSRGCLWSA